MGSAQDRTTVYDTLILIKRSGFRLFLLLSASQRLRRDTGYVGISSRLVSTATKLKISAANNLALGNGSTLVRTSNNHKRMNIFPLCVWLQKMAKGKWHHYSCQLNYGTGWVRQMNVMELRSNGWHHVGPVTQETPNYSCASFKCHIIFVATG